MRGNADGAVGMVGAVIVGDAPEGSNVESVSLTGRALLPLPSTAVTSTGEGSFDSLWLIIPLSAGIAIAMGGGGFVLGMRRGKP